MTRRRNCTKSTLGNTVSCCQTGGQATTQDRYLPGSDPLFSLPFNDIHKNTNKIRQDQTPPLYIKANGCPGAICIYGEQEEGSMITQRSTTSSDVILKHISCRVFKQLRPKVKHKQQVVLSLVQRGRGQVKTDAVPLPPVVFTPTLACTWAQFKLSAASTFHPHGHHTVV